MRAYDSTWLTRLQYNCTTAVIDLDAHSSWLSTQATGHSRLKQLAGADKFLAGVGRGVR